MSGRVVFAGAGPGSESWLTVAVRDAIAAADIVFVDALVAPSVLSDVRWGAEVIDVGKRGGKPSTPQSEICRLLVSHAGEGMQVLRLKGGDPCTFGRLAEEIDAVRTAGIAYTILPGISAASAVAARAGISLTDRDTSASLTLLTGHRRAEGPHPEMDWAAASRSGTGAVYMGVLNARDNIARLFAEGVSPQTPALAARSVTTPRERLLAATLEELPEAMDQAALRPPALWLYGDVVRQAQTTAATPPPAGYVALFRPRGKAEPWRQQLRDAGWEPCLYPLQKIEAKPIPEDIWSASQTDRPTWFVFTSPTAVACWWSGYCAGHDVRGLAGVQIAAVGSATAEALKQLGLACDLVGSGNTGAQALVEELPGTPARVVWLRAEDGDTQAAAWLSDRGWDMRHVETHRKIAAKLCPGALRIAMERRLLNAAIWTSASQVHLVRQSASPDWWDTIPHITIGEKTAAALREFDVERLHVAEQSDFDGVLAQLRRAGQE